jgi:hypothetical protein
VVSVPGPSISLASDRADWVESLDPAIVARNEIPVPFSKSRDTFNWFSAHWKTSQQLKVS